MADPEATTNGQCMTRPSTSTSAVAMPLEGQLAVAEVILNRRDSGRYPSTVCGVVEQGTGEKWMCQFSYYCDGLSDEVTDRRSWEHLGRVARVMLDGAPRDLTDGAMFYHTKAVNPYWADQFFETAEIGAHLFYTDEDIQMASNASAE
jgi:spore germination cell wall hydrolase CwlJ-like protein